MEGNHIKILTLKSGDLGKASDLKEGSQYCGVVTYFDRRGTYDMDVTLVIGKATREKTAMGIQNLVPVTTTIKNSDGKGGTATVQVKFSPTLKVNLEEKMTGSLPERGWFCAAKAIRPRRDIDAGFQFRFDVPAAGAVLKYQCEGPVKSREIRVVSNANGLIKFSVLRDGKLAGELTSEAWQFYANMAREAVLPGNKKITTNIKGTNELSQLNVAGVKPGGYHGRVVSTGTPLSDYPVRVAIHPKAAFNTKEFGNLSVIPVYSFQGTSVKDVVKTYYLYSEQLKAPVLYSVMEKLAHVRNQRCRLIAHSGFAAKK